MKKFPRQASEFPREPKARFTIKYFRTLDRIGDEPVSASGPGSSMEQTEVIRRELPELFKRHGISSVLDAPCGDFFWMQHCDLTGIAYTGADIVDELIESNRKRFAGPDRRFELLNIISDPLPKVDLILCRDCLVHMSFEQIFETLGNFKASGSRYLLATTFTSKTENPALDYEKTLWRALNLQLAPLRFPKPLDLINEGCKEKGDKQDKSLGLWRLKDIQAQGNAHLLENPKDFGR